MPTSREQILTAVRANQPPATPVPQVEGQWIEYADIVAQFCGLLKTIGSAGHLVDSVDQINAILAEMPVYQQATRICSLVPGVGDSSVHLDAIARAHELDQLDIAIVAGEIAVAENGAVWVSDTAIKHRALLFMAEHLILVVPASGLVPHLHAAYDSLRLPEFPDGRKAFGGFISGPSKTADIEQSLVIGAQGPRSSAVFLLR
jgi:L-lactate dehydrogenase complex protein LldG